MPETNERQKEVIEGGCRVQVVTFRGSRALDGQGNPSESEIPHLAGNGMLSARKYCSKLRHFMAHCISRLSVFATQYEVLEPPRTSNGVILSFLHPGAR